MMTSFCSDLLRAIKEELHLFCENSQRPKEVDYFRKKAPPQKLDWIPDVLPVTKVLEMWGVGRLQVYGMCSRRLVRREVVET